MSWIPSSPLFSVVFTHGPKAERAKLSNKGITTMDVVPHRWCVDKVGLEHAIVHLAVRWIRDSNSLVRHPHWNVVNHNGSHTHHQNMYQDDRFDTPDWGFEAGGVLFHQGAPAPDACLTLHLGEDGLHLPDGRVLPLDSMIATADMAYNWLSEVSENNILRIMRDVTQHPNTDDLHAQICAFLAGYARAALAHKGDLFTTLSYHKLIGNNAPTAAAIALHGLQSHGKTGQDATKAVKETTATASHDACRGWLLRPEQALAPTRWVAGRLMDAVDAAIAATPRLAPLHAAGQACGALVMEGHGVPDLTILQHPERAKSAHEVLAHKSLAKAFTNVALRALAAQPDLLRPQTARKALALLA